MLILIILINTFCGDQRYKNVKVKVLKHQRKTWIYSFITLEWGRFYQECFKNVSSMKDFTI